MLDKKTRITKLNIKVLEYKILVLIQTLGINKILIKL